MGNAQVQRTRHCASSAGITLRAQTQELERLGLGAGVSLYKLGQTLAVSGDVNNIYKRNVAGDQDQDPMRAMASCEGKQVAIDPGISARRVCDLMSQWKG